MFEYLITKETVYYEIEPEILVSQISISENDVGFILTPTTGWWERIYDRLTSWYSKTIGFTYQYPNEQFLYRGIQDAIKYFPTLAIAPRVAKSGYFRIIQIASKTEAHITPQTLEKFLLKLESIVNQDQLVLYPQGITNKIVDDYQDYFTQRMECEKDFLYRSSNNPCYQNSMGDDPNALDRHLQFITKFPSPGFGLPGHLPSPAYSQECNELIVQHEAATSARLSTSLAAVVGGVFVLTVGVVAFLWKKNEKEETVVKKKKRRKPEEIKEKTPSPPPARKVIDPHLKAQLDKERKEAQDKNEVAVKEMHELSELKQQREAEEARKRLNEEKAKGKTNSKKEAKKAKIAAEDEQYRLLMENEKKAQALQAEKQKKERREKQLYDDILQSAHNYHLDRQILLDNAIKLLEQFDKNSLLHRLLAADIKRLSACLLLDDVKWRTCYFEFVSHAEELRNSYELVITVPDNLRRILVSLSGCLQSDEVFLCGSALSKLIMECKKQDPRVDLSKAANMQNIKLSDQHFHDVDVFVYEDEFGQGRLHDLYIRNKKLKNYYSAMQYNGLTSEEEAAQMNVGVKLSHRSHPLVKFRDFTAYAFVMDLNGCILVRSKEAINDLLEGRFTLNVDLQQAAKKDPVIIARIFKKILIYSPTNGNYKKLRKILSEWIPDPKANYSHFNYYLYTLLTKREGNKTVLDLNRIDALANLLEDEAYQHIVKLLFNNSTKSIKDALVFRIESDITTRTSSLAKMKQSPIRVIPDELIKRLPGIIKEVSMLLFDAELSPYAAFSTLVQNTYLSQLIRSLSQFINEYIKQEKLSFDEMFKCQTTIELIEELFNVPIDTSDQNYNLAKCYALIDTLSWLDKSLQLKFNNEANIIERNNKH